MHSSSQAPCNIPFTQAVQPQSWFIVSKGCNCQSPCLNCSSLLLNVSNYHECWLFFTHNSSCLSNQYLPLAQKKKSQGDDLEREASLETIVVKLFLCFQSFSAESSSSLLVPHTKISLPSEVRNSLKKVFVDINSTLPSALFASHIIHIFVSYMYFSQPFLKQCPGFIQGSPIRGQVFCR